MTTMPAPTGPSTEKLIALVTNGSQFAGPAALLGLKYLNCQVYVHDPSFSDDAQRDAFASDHNGVIPLAGNRLSVANDVMKAEGRLDILIENPAPRGEAHVTDDDNVAALDEWLTDAAREVITEPFELLNFAARAMRQRSRGVIIFSPRRRGTGRSTGRCTTPRCGPPTPAWHWGQRATSLPRGSR